MAGTTAWVVGSVKDMDMNVTIDGSLENISGSRYLYITGGGSLSLLYGMISAMSSAGVAGPSAVLTKDRRVKLATGGGINFSVAWTDTALRDLLGFTGDLVGATSYIAPNVSPLLWSPLKPLKFELSPGNTLGMERPLSYYTMSPSDGTAFVVSHGFRTDQLFTCASVDIARVFTAAKAGGEFVRFFNEVWAKGYQFYVYPSVAEVAGSTDTATVNGGLGPYVWTPEQRAPTWKYTRSRGFTWTDHVADIEIPCRDAAEYS